jgi:mono/diheme cytochrome c family protein
MRVQVWGALVVALSALLPLGAGAQGMEHKDGTELAVPAFLPVTVSGQGLKPFLDLAGTKATVVVFVGTACPISNGYAPEYAKLAKSLKAQGGQLVLVYSNPGDASEAEAHAARFGLTDAVRILDEDQALMKKLGAKMTPEAFVLDEKRIVRYCGAIDDKYVERGKPKAAVREKFLENAAQQVIAGKFVLLPRTEPFGCDIESKKAVVLKDAPTYAGSVAKILNASCVSCHRPGETGPMPLDTFEGARRFADNIAGVTSRKQMPPWKPAPGHGSFQSERRLTDAQIKTLAEWASAGAPPGDLTKAPRPQAFTQGWALGKPDLVLTMPTEYEVPASGADIYRCFVLPIPLDADKEVTAVEYRPGNRTTVHHVIGYLDGNGLGRQKDEQDPGPGFTSFGGPGFMPTGELGGWVPGLTPQPLPDGIARPLKKGTDLVMQIHYHPSGKPEKDKTQVGIYFGKKKATKLLRILPIVQFNLDIPAGADKHEVNAAFPLPLPFDAKAIFIIPHMHLLGRTMRVDSLTPEGKSIPLLKIDDWDFNWQDMYSYKSPLTLVRGSKLSLLATYDNSEKNPRQPALPPRRVTWGEETTDEMCLAFIGFVPDNENDPMVKLYDMMLKAGAKKKMEEMGK